MLPTHVVRLVEDQRQGDALPPSANAQHQRKEDAMRRAEGAPAVGTSDSFVSQSSYPPTQRDAAAQNGQERFYVTSAHARPQSGNGGSSSSTKNGITALTVQAQTPYSVNGGPNANGNGSQAAKRPSMEAAPPRWNTWEFRFYGLVFAVMVPLMIWVPIRLSFNTSQNYALYARYLVPGWLFGRKRDDSDFQYKSFRDYVPVLVAVMLVYLLISKLSERLGRPAQYQGVSAKTIRPHRVVFLCCFTAVFVLTLHGLNTMKLLAVCLVNYGLTQALGGSVFGLIAAWTWNVGALFAVHSYDGFQFASLSSNLAWMDDLHGLLPRWQINFNITMLRLISFALDYHWSRTAPCTAEQQQIDSDGPIVDARKRSDVPLAASEYNFTNYFLYLLYPPLFIAGPIVTFHDFVRQLHNPLPIPPQHTARYAVRLVLTMLTMEFMLHFMYVNAIKDAKAWQGTSPMELSMIGFWNLIVVWLKLLIPWRFFRLWALADGVDPPENMIRCMANNYSTLGFWRSWHRSYNLWIVRYIYVPVGGAKNVVPATLLVFTFVALWHDLSLKLLTWGWLVTLFIVPEILARKAIPQQRFGRTTWYRHLAAAGGVFNILLMMTANLVGFAIGTDGMKYMWQQLLSSWSGECRSMVAAIEPCSVRLTSLVDTCFCEQQD